MDPIDSQIQQAISRSSAVELALNIAAGLVLLCGLLTLRSMELPAMLVVFGATVAVAVALLGFAAHLGLKRARLLLAWQRP
jgi:hypothetical protein